MPVSYFCEMSDVLMVDETSISVNFNVLAAGRLPAKIGNERLRLVLARLLSVTLY